jgi:hypothetical protein
MTTKNATTDPRRNKTEKGNAPNSFKKEILESYLEPGRKDASSRSHSWSHCYQAFCEKKDENFLSLHLGFYLASWGMYRGSSGLLQKDYTVHHGAVEIIRKAEYTDLHFTRENRIDLSKEEELISKMLMLKKELEEYYERIKYLKDGEKQSKKVTATETLISKIMLGSLACVPAYDRFFIDGLRAGGIKGLSFSKKSLQSLFQFIRIHEEALREIQTNLYEKDKVHYPIMKLVDMYFWMCGVGAQ